MSKPFGDILSNQDVNPWTRHRDLVAALGAVSWPFMLPTSSAVPTSRTIGVFAHYLYRDEVIANIGTCVQTAAVGTVPTLIKLGLWDSGTTPRCLAVTANLNSDSSWTSQGWKVLALASSWRVTADGLYYTAFLKNGAFATTDLQLAAAPLGSVGTPIGSGKRLYGAVSTTATDMAVSDSGAYSQAGSIPFTVPLS